MPIGRSIHIGVNAVDPQCYGGWSGPLQACEQDARDMATIAKGLGYAEPTLLLTRDANSTNLIAAMQDAAAKLQSGDILFLTYSGHGGQVPDRDGKEEPDFRDETWCLHDRQVIDDELNGLFTQFARDVRIVVLSDSCHSGTVTRDGQREAARTAPLDVTYADYKRRKDVYAELQATNAEAQAKVADGEIGAGVLLVSGCQDNQLSLDGRRNGLFTSMLLKVWNGGAFDGNYVRLHDAIKRLMPPSQTPNLARTGRLIDGFAKQQPFSI